MSSRTFDANAEPMDSAAAKTVANLMGRTVWVVVVEEKGECEDSGGCCEPL